MRALNMKMTALLMVAAAAVLVPLYGDPRGGTVTHPQWARMLLSALEMEGSLPENAPPAQVFSALSWKGSRAFAADRYQSATAVALQSSGGTRIAVATESEGEVVYPLSVLTGGDYHVRARLSGSPERPAVAELVPAGQTAPAGSVTLAPSPVMGWVDGGILHLDRGVYSAVVRLPAGASLESLEVAPPCVTAVEPLRGWSENAVADSIDVAATVIKAVDKESELPPAAAPIEVYGEAFREESGGQPAAVSTTVAAAGGLRGGWITGGPGPRRAVAFVELPEAGLYTLSAYGLVGGGQGWSADACRKAIVCPPLDAAAGRQPEWRTLMTAPFTAGRHVFTVTLRDGSALQRFRAERKKSTGPDYVATLRRLGFDVGDGVVSRAKAEEAMAFVRQGAVKLLASRCGDIALPDGALRVAGFQPASIVGHGIAPGDSGVGQNPVADPAVPLDFPSATPTTAPPTTTPTTTPTAPPTQPPASPRPTPAATPAPTPTPSPIPPQPPGSGVTPTPAPLS